MGISIDELKEVFAQIWIGWLHPFTKDFWINQWLSVLLYLVLLGGGYFLIIYMADPGDNKRRAWILSLISAVTQFLLCAPISVHWLVKLICDSDEARNSLATGGTYVDAYMAGFLVFLWADLLVSSIWFPGHLEILAGWVHHIVYWNIVGNALHNHWSKGLDIMFIQELPTAILSFGMAYPDMKFEKAFGYTFALLRIAFHLIVTITAVTADYPQNMISIPAFLAFAVHLWWFRGWLKRQRRLKILRSMSLETAENDVKFAEIQKELDEAVPLKLDSLIIDTDPLEGAPLQLSARSETVPLRGRSP